MLENLTSSQPHLSAGYQKFSPNPPLVDEVIYQNPSLVNPTLSKRESHDSIPDQPLVENMADMIPPLFDHTFPIESELRTT